ncbi:MAG: hypothetical protein HYZ37_14820 [Candidatus Solibacter usitatus]|nr:hypothetical protein [Candidatus Solibacter usitatus]
MWKTGTFEAEKFDPASTSTVRWVSYRLLEAGIPPTEKEVAIFERLMFHIQLSGGVYRTTFANRFRDLDPWINAALIKNFHQSTHLQAQDWAASDCLTSSQWAGSLFQLFPNATLTASDLTLFLIEFTNSDGESYFVEPDGNPLQYFRKPFVLNLKDEEPWMFPLNRMLQTRAKRRWEEIRGGMSWPRQWVQSEATEMATPGGVFRKILVVHPKARQLASSNPAFRIAQHSVFEPSPALCHVVRTMNILNKAYFPCDGLRKGAESVYESLLDGGVWIAGRTVRDSPPQHEVTLFRKENGWFRKLDQVGPGSELEPLILG